MSSSDIAQALLVGVALVAFGGVLMWTHRRSWAKQQQDELEEFERRHFYRRYRRRMQVSGMLVLLGIVIPPGMLFLTEKHPAAFGFFWLAVLILVVWIILLAVADMFSIRTYGNISQARLDLRKRELEAELARLKSQQSNGAGPSGNGKH